MLDKEYLNVYPYSLADARERDELALWQQSRRENVCCKEAIEEAIRKDFDGMHLKNDSVQSVIEQFGYKRTAFVLANSIQEKEYDGRFSIGNKKWANSLYIPTDKINNRDFNGDFAVDSHPAVLDGFVSQYCKAYQALGLFDYTHCVGDKHEQDFEGKVVVLSPSILKDRYLCPENQLWLATGGFGSHPYSSGRAVFATCLRDGEKTRWNREDIVGVLDEKHLPDWAREKLKELQLEEPCRENKIGGQSM